LARTDQAAFSELLARIRTLLRRVATSNEKVLETGALNIDLITRKASCGDELLELTPPEFDVLTVLANRCGDIVSRAAPHA
jgi:DNA-binding response OmpR family regulator